MDKEYSEKYAETLLDYAFDMLWLRETCGVNHAEFIFVHLSEFISDYPMLKPWFIKNIKLTFEGNWSDLAKKTTRPHGFIPSELIEYIAHVKKWPELEKLALNELEKHKVNQVYLINRNLPSSILEALNSNWKDKEMYKSLNTDL